MLTQPQTVSATTVRNYVSDLKAFASWLEREGYTGDNVLGNLCKPKSAEAPVELFNRAELDAIWRRIWAGCSSTTVWVVCSIP